MLYWHSKANIFVKFTFSQMFNNIYVAHWCKFTVVCKVFDVSYISAIYLWVYNSTLLYILGFGTTNLLKAGNFKPIVPAIFDSLPCIKKAAEIEDFNVGQEIQRFQRSAPQLVSKQKQNKVSAVYLKKTQQSTVFI